MELDASTVLPRIADLIGCPVWLVKKGHGSFLTFEAGLPRLLVQEPRAVASDSESVRRAYARRLVTVRGDWHLWIYMCNWRISADGALLAHSESSDQEIDRAASALDGQKIVAVAIDPSTGGSRFEFDLGRSLECSPYEPGDDEVWMLFTPEKQVLNWRADGVYSLTAEEAPPGSEVWIHPVATQG